MIVYLISFLIAGAIGFRLGTYVTIISTAVKVAAVLLMIGALVLLYRKFRRVFLPPRLPWLTDK